MKQRILTGALVVALLVPIVIFSWTPLLPIIIAFCSVISIREILHCIGLQKSPLFSVPLYLMAATIPVITRFLAHGSLFASQMPEASAKHLAQYGCILMVAVLMYFFTIMTFSHGKYKLESVCVLFAASFYILMGFNSIVIMHDNEMGGRVVFLAIFIGAWVTDVFAYFCGMLFGRGGKHKLIPDVSPKKTVEGSIGGIVFCMIAMVLFGILCNYFTEYDAKLWVFAIGGLLASVVAQIGDLLMSVIKRTYGIKDYGKLFPGHGGMLDRFDSILAVAIAMVCFTSFIDFF